MAIITTFRFTPDSGAICIDQESWHIWRRKNWFTDHLYILLDQELSDRFGIELVYGGVGHPPFHLETAEYARRMLREYLTHRNPETDTITVQSLGSIVLEAFQNVHGRRVNDKLNYLFGFDRDDFNAGTFTTQDSIFSIQDDDVKTRALDIVQGKENTGYGPLTPPVEACLIGIDRQYGYSAFCLKEKDGVLGFQSCWFEALGQGRQGAAIRFAKLLNQRTLSSRRQGEGQDNGLYHLMDAVSEAMDHYGQDGGFVRMMLLDGNAADRRERLRDIRDDAARLCVEIIKAARHDLLPKQTAVELLRETVQPDADIDTLEQKFFNSVPDPIVLGKFLRRYKIQEPGLPGKGPEKDLFSGAADKAAVGSKGDIS
jgi:hypothetical protein